MNDIVLYTFNERHFRKFGLPLDLVNPASHSLQ